MAESNKEINIIELLMDIKSDVSSIKTDISNFKDSQKAERENISKEIKDARSDCKRDLNSLETKVMGKIQGLQSIQNSLVGDVDTLKHFNEREDAKKWRTVLAFVATSLGSIVLVKLPDFISFCLNLNQIGGK